MEAINTLTQLLTHSDCQHIVFDLGRRIETIDNQDFAKIERGQMPYPYPVQRQAQLAIAYWNETGQPWIWFLKFELDERGLLNSGDLSNFIKYISDAMGSRLQGELSQEQQQALADNPYTFKPKEDKLAVFNAMIRTKLDMPASQYIDHADHYLQGQLGWNNWQTVGLQGIADLCARLRFANYERTLKAALPHLPSQPLYAVLGALEHCDISASMATTLSDRLEDELAKPQVDLFLVAALVRALAGDVSGKSVLAIERVLATSELCHREMMVAIAGRCWHPLSEPHLAERYLIRLAETGEQALFNQIFADLVMLPKLRMVLLPLLNQAPSAELERALLSLQQSTRAGQ